MKTHILIALIFWMIISLILTLSIIGNLVWVRSDTNVENWKGDAGRSTWARVGHSLCNKLIED
jgi:hypothetical protein